MKQFSTPTLQITLKDTEGATAADLLNMADEVVVTLSDGVTDIDVTPSIDGNIILATLTEEQTGSLSSGTIQAEITLRLNTKVMKSKTMKIKMLEAVRDKALGGDA